MESPVVRYLLREITMTTDSASVGVNTFVNAQTAPSLQKRLLAILREWQRRIHERRELAGLSELELRDIGYPAEIEAEKSKPFWRA
jgi:uncharacterized protein YjiS (DUF1127 family)